MSARTRYEAYYGFGMLDDLHNFFPDLLYNNGRFNSVQSVFAYMNSQMNDNFNLYSIARSQTSRNVRPRRSLEEDSIRPPHMASTSPQRGPARRSYFDDLAHLDANVGQQRVAQPAPPAPATAATAPPQQVRRRTPSTLFPGVEIVTTDYIYQPTGGMMPVNGAGGTTAALASIASLLGIELGGFGDVAAAGFADPVPVRPTAAQISAATSEEIVATGTNDLSCAICQDDIASGTVMRTINHCDHSFHKTCIDTWFAQNVHCPVCRHDIRETHESEESESEGETQLEAVD